MNSPYTKVTHYDEDENYEARTELIVSRFDRDTRTVYVPKGTPEYKIPARNTLNLDLDAINEARAWSNKIREDLS